MPWQSAYVGVGSNLDQPVLQVRRALAALAELPQTRLLARSSLYGSRPFGVPDQPDFVNAVAVLQTRLPVRRFFTALRALETRLGREPPRMRWGARRIDLDLLLFARLQLATPELTLPHPGIAQRNFVLYPLREVAPELTVPGDSSVAELAARVPRDGIWRLDAAPAAFT